MSRQKPSDDPRIQTITACWRHLRHIEHPSCPDGSSPPKTEEMAAIIAGLYGLTDKIEGLKNKHDQLWVCYEHIYNSGLPHHKLGKYADRNPAKIIRGLAPESGKRDRARVRGPGIPKQEMTYERWVNSPAFLRSSAWKKIRYQALLRSRGRCELCGAGKEQGVVLNVDHIKPRRKFPELALTLENLQVLDSACNLGKGNWDQTDWRSASENEPNEAAWLEENGMLNLDLAFKRVMGSA